MSVSMDFERTVAAFLEADGPADMDPGLVDGALLEVRGLPQRRGWLRLSGTAPWPARRAGERLEAGTVPAAWIAAVLLLVLGLMATAVVGSRLLLVPDPGPPPSGAPAILPPDATPTLDPASAAPARTSGPFSSGEIGARGPCAPMLQMLQTYVTEGAIVPADRPIRRSGEGAIVYTASETGGLSIERLAPAGDRLVPDAEPEPDDVVMPSTLPPSPTGRLVPSPDGRALAIEEGDLGQAGCGDPIVVLADGGRTRPFPTQAFQLVTDIAWAPDGSTLYGVRRPTVDADGKPYWDPDIARRVAGPGTVLRWDARSGEVEELPQGCGTCESLVVSPDGGRLAAWGDGQLWVFEGDGWRAFLDLPVDRYAEHRVLRGWADPDSVVLADRRVIGIDGSTVAEWPEPCCHGTGFASVLSPDGTTLAGVTLNEDLGGNSVTLLDTRDGSTRSIWSPGPFLDCASSFGSTEAPECQGSPDPTPDPMAISGYAKVVAWAPDGSAVLVAQPFLDSTRMRLWVVPVDGSGPGQGLDVAVPDLSPAHGFPNEGSGIAWLPTP